MAFLGLPPEFIQQSPKLLQTVALIGITVLEEGCTLLIVWEICFQDSLTAARLEPWVGGAESQCTEKRFIFLSLRVRPCGSSTGHLQGLEFVRVLFVYRLPSRWLVLLWAG